LNCPRAKYGCEINGGAVADVGNDASIFSLVPPHQLGVAPKVIFSAALFVWAGDEILRGVNPWRRCLGVAVLCYGLWTLPR
jgi:hypothetical protein